MIEVDPEMSFMSNNDKVFDYYLLDGEMAHFEPPPGWRVRKMFAYKPVKRWPWSRSLPANVCIICEPISVPSAGSGL